MWRTACSLLAGIVVLVSTGANCEGAGPFKFSQTGEPGGVIVQLFQWRFDDIAYECEDFLGPKGFAGVEVSPVTEHIVLDGRPWRERYQPLSYKIASRSGNEAEFTDMVKRCNKAGVKIYVDVIMNHMTASHSYDDVGSGGSHVNSIAYSYPAVPFTKDDFNTPCEITHADWCSAEKIRNCELLGLHDLNQTKPCVRTKIRKFLNKLVSIGVAGFRVDSAKHMWPDDLKAIFGNLRYLDSTQGFACESAPYIYLHYAGDTDDNDVQPVHYYSMGPVTDFKYAYEVSRAFRRENPLKFYHNFDESWGLLQRDKSFVFIDDHNTQRGEGYQGHRILSHHQSTEYKMAIAFMLAYNYGQPRVMSSYTFDRSREDSKRKGPPGNADGTIQKVVHAGDLCTNGYICEHRWRQIYNMVKFRNVVGSAPVTHWWDNGMHQAAFGRGDKGFIAFNADSHTPLKTTLQTGLPEGTYCDLISGLKVNGKCTGLTIKVDASKKVQVDLPYDQGERMMATTIEDKLGDEPAPAPAEVKDKPTTKP